MRCPRCGASNKTGADHCRICQYPLLQNEDNEQEVRRVFTPGLKILYGVLIAIGAILTAFFVGFLIYKLHFGIKNTKLEKLYTDGGKYTPMIEEIVMDDNRSGHAVTFYGNDGDCIFLEELNESRMIVGGSTRFEFADSMWFDFDPNDIESAIVKFSPILISPQGEKTAIPQLRIVVTTPAAPIKLIQPSGTSTSVIVSTQVLQGQVLYGSDVFVNGADITSYVDKNGDFSVTLPIEPIGENIISLLVRTPYHKENRMDIVVNRARMEINLEIDSGVSMTSQLDTMLISGKMDPGAVIEVDTPYVEDSLTFDQIEGTFSFKAKFSSYGKNQVQFRAKMDGKQDSAIGFDVNYVPSLAEYSRKAWKMDYPQLRTLYEQWKGRVFLCTGVVKQTFVTDDNIQYFVMDVGKDGEEQLLVLENSSNYGIPLVGSKYDVYAEVTGRYYLDAYASYYPMLCARYVSSAK